MIIIGIDPGQKGGIGIIGKDNPTAIILPMLGKDVDINRLRALMFAFKPDKAIVEHQAGRYSTPYSYGLIIGCLMTLQIPIVTVTPMKWQRELLGRIPKGSSKDEAIGFALKMFPTVEFKPEGSRKYHDGMADALCLAEWGRRFA